jgi:hypothetical protein
MCENKVGAVSGENAGDIGKLALLEDFIIKYRKGVFTDDEVKRFLQRKEPFAVSVSVDFREQIVVKIKRFLLKRFGQEIAVDPLPQIWIEENLKKAARFNLRPVFSLGKELNEILKKFKPKNWVPLPEKFFQWERNKKIAPDSAVWPRGWYLADFTVGADYTDGIQVFRNDPLSPLIEELRRAGKVGKYDKTPMGSRFAIVPNSEWPLVFWELADRLGFVTTKQISLEPFAAFNAIGNIYDKNRGKFNMWEWFSDTFGDSYRLFGGIRRSGGLANVDYDWDGCRLGSIAGRPLVSFQ